MKKLLNFLRSMKFGMILLLAILACSLVGSFIPQGSARDYYLTTYPDWGNLLLTLKFDGIFSSWYFAALNILLCVNLIFCSVLRLGTTMKTMRAMPLAAAKAEPDAAVLSGKWVEAFLKARRFRPIETEAGSVLAKNRIGHFGSFIVHLAMLLLLLCGTAVLYFSETQDVTVHVGETTALSDGTELHLNSFRSADADGSTDYVSQLAVRDASGTVTSGEISVNHPLTAAGYKLYQYNYGTDGQLEITYDNKSETLYLTADDEENFYSVDGENGLTYYGLYPDYTLDANGKAELITETDGGYPNPIYAVNILEGGGEKFGLVNPGETLTVGGIFFTFGQPVDYSVIRIKTYPAGMLALLYCSFVLLIAGLWLCFFQIPIYVKVHASGYTVRSPKPATDFISSLKSLEKEGTVQKHA
jgi:cytochrome c biogenesis protein